MDAQDDHPPEQTPTGDSQEPPDPDDDSPLLRDLRERVREVNESRAHLQRLW